MLTISFVQGEVTGNSAARPVVALWPKKQRAAATAKKGLSKNTVLILREIIGVGRWPGRRFSGWQHSLFQLRRGRGIRYSHAEGIRSYRTCSFLFRMH